MFDIAIIGAGIIGSFLAKDLSKYNFKVAVIEKGNDIALGATMANSAIIHSGHDPKEGTLKAKLNVRGNEMYEQVCADLNCTFKRIGAYVLATNDEECKTLEQLYLQAQKRKIESEIQEACDIKKHEPNLSKDVVKGLWLPTTAIIYPWEVAIALLENAVDNGVQLLLNEEVYSIDKDEYYRIHTTNTTIDAKVVINCAGVFADEIYRMVSKNVPFSITARKGEYFVLDKLVKPLVNHVIYPVPSKLGKGVLIVPTTHGNTLLGPTSFEIDDKKAINNTKAGLDYVREQISKLIEPIPMDKVIRTFAGNRPSGSTHDFIIEEANDCPYFYNVAAIESPGLASAPAISEYLINMMKNKIVFESNPKYIPKRKPYLDLKQCTEAQRDELVKSNPQYAHMVCRCECVTEGEIVDAIHRTCGATTVKGVKKRVRPGMGRCQGGFCEPLVVDILARELNIDKKDVCLDGLKSQLLVERTKGNHDEDC